MASTFLLHCHPSPIVGALLLQPPSELPWTVCVWLASCSTLNVVAPTVPDRLAEGPASYVSRRIRTSV